MGWTSELASLRRQLTNEFGRWLANTFVVTLTSRSSSLGDTDAIESSDMAADPGAPSSESKTQRPAARYQPWGFNGRPPKGVRGLALRLGTSNVIWIGIAPNQSYGPQNLDVGESAMYSIGGSTIVLDKDGNVIVTPAAGKTVQLGGNSYALPHWDDFVTAFNSFISTLTTVTNATASVVATAATNYQTAAGLGSNFKSTVAKNG